MENIQIISTERDGVINENVVVTHDDGSTTIWIKSVYDEQVAAQVKDGWTEPQLTKF